MVSFFSRQHGLVVTLCLLAASTTGGLVDLSLPLKAQSDPAGVVRLGDAAPLPTPESSPTAAAGGVENAGGVEGTSSNASAPTGQPEGSSPVNEPPVNESAPSTALAAPGAIRAAPPAHSPNRLAKESSPYLLQHARNPVDWFPWSDEAFAKAKAENKLIFLSVGYSTCYWCHVMEKKVFEDPEIAAYLNEHFVCIKVDREERPDLDEVYMTSLIVYLQAIGAPASGGWPLSMFLTPQGQPIAGGTYFPPENQGESLGFRTVTQRLVNLWETQQAKLEENARIITSETQRLLKPQLVLKPVPLDEALVQRVGSAVAESFDEEHGGLDFDPQQPEGPKFPVSAKFLLLLQLNKRQANPQLRQVVENSLTAMALGGIRDHLAGGFHRYSVDRRWDVPHFEKMLYDQGQLLHLYAAAYEQFQQPLFKQVAEEIVSFVDAELTSPEGAFYSALDAQTGGVEGDYYVWSAAEVDKLLGSQAGPFQKLYGIVETPAFEQGNVLRLASVESLSATQSSPIQLSRQTLLAARRMRTSPVRDEKILTAWNALMIRGLATAGRVFNQPAYTERATRAARFLLTQSRNDEGRLQHTVTAGHSKLNAYLDDYAYLIQALLELHTTTQSVEWLTAAEKLQQEQDTLFADAAGGYFFTAADHEVLLARTKNAYDTVVPSGNGVSAQNLMSLFQRTGTKTRRTQAGQVVRVFGGVLENTPRGSTSLAMALATGLDTAAPRSSAPSTTAAVPAAPATPATEPPATTTDTNTTEATNTETSSPAANPPELAAIPARNPAVRARSTPGVVTAAASEEEADPTSQAQQSSEAGQTIPQRPARVRQASGDETETGGAKDQKITIRAYLSTDRLPAGQQCRIVVLIDVAEGWHINANPPQPDFAVPTTVKFKSRQGVKLVKPVYPKGEMLKVAGVDDPISVYEGQVRVDGVLEVPAEASGQIDDMEIEVRYQACDADHCLIPKVARLTGKLPVAKTGEAVRNVNEKLFAAQAITAEQ